MVTWIGAEPNKEAMADDEAAPRGPAKPEPDGKLEDAVRRAMNDLEQEKMGSGDNRRARATAW